MLFSTFPGSALYHFKYYLLWQLWVMVYPHPLPPFALPSFQKSVGVWISFLLKHAFTFLLQLCFLYFCTMLIYYLANLYKYFKRTCIVTVSSSRIYYTILFAIRNKIYVQMYSFVSSFVGDGYSLNLFYPLYDKEAYKNSCPNFWMGCLTLIVLEHDVVWRRLTKNTT